MILGVWIPCLPLREGMRKGGGVPPEEQCRHRHSAGSCMARHAPGARRPPQLLLLLGRQGQLKGCQSLLKHLPPSAVLHPEPREQFKSISPGLVVVLCAAIFGLAGECWVCWRGWWPGGGCLFGWELRAGASYGVGAVREIVTAATWENEHHVHLEPMVLFVVSHSYGKEEFADGFPVGPCTSLLCGVLSAYTVSSLPPCPVAFLPSPGAPISGLTLDGARVEVADLTPCSCTGFRDQLLPPGDDLGGSYSLT